MLERRNSEEHKDEFSGLNNTQEIFLITVVVLVFSSLVMFMIARWVRKAQMEKSSVVHRTHEVVRLESNSKYFPLKGLRTFIPSLYR